MADQSMLDPDRLALIVDAALMASAKQGAGVPVPYASALQDAYGTDAGYLARTAPMVAASVRSAVVAAVLTGDDVVAAAVGAAAEVASAVVVHELEPALALIGCLSELLAGEVGNSASDVLRDVLNDLRKVARHG